MVSPVIISSMFGELAVKRHANHSIDNNLGRYETLGQFRKYCLHERPLGHKIIQSHLQSRRTTMDRDLILRFV
jgi:hypothetical protein